MTIMARGKVTTGIVLLLIVHVDVSYGETAEEWSNMAKAELDMALRMKPNDNIAKNVIVFLGDGMGASTVTAARVLKAELEGKKGKQPPLTFETFPAVGLSKTYSNDRLTASSAATATAILGGIKANDGTLGVNPSVSRGDCAASKTETGRVTSILKWAADQGKSAGFVTTSRVTHATPAAAYAHSADRNWEGTTEVPAGCKDIAAQLFDNMDLKVILGGGRRYILMNNQTDPQTGTIHSKQRTDGRDLIQEWKDKHVRNNVTAAYVYKKSQFDEVSVTDTDYLLGLFAQSHMSYDADRDVGPDGQPSLTGMTRKAIQILKKNNKGFALLVEGARIDHGHHENYGKRALLDTIALSDAVAAAVAETDEKDTLIVVTADHSHVFNIAGYPSRQSDILGFVDVVEYFNEPTNKGPYTTLVYGNGPGPHDTNLTGVDTGDINFRQPVAVQMPEETHAGEDVAIYARGPMSHLIHGVHEQHYIAHVMAYASCVGSGKKRCTDTRVNNCPISGARSRSGPGSPVTLSIALVLTYLLFSK